MNKIKCSQFNDLDKYIQKVDENFCTSNCTCDIYKEIDDKNWLKEISSQNSSINLIDNGINNSIISFQNCSMKNFTIKEFEKLEIDFDFLEFIETTYKCSGYCDLSYINSFNENKTINKYLFSNINKARPEFREGCFKAILYSYKSYLNGIYIFIVIISIFILNIIISLFSYLCSKENHFNDNQNIMLSQISKIENN